MSTVNPPGHCNGKGFTGWAHGLENGTFGSVHFGLHLTPEQTDSFEVAICKAYHPTPAPPTPAPPTPRPLTPAPPTPAPVAPTPQPTLPNNKPYIRFGHAIPTSNRVWATITQNSTSYTWKNFGFAEFSSWVEIFAEGFGSITIYESTASGAQGSALVTTEIPLTPGPLVVVVKDYWPPRTGTNVETIAASYNPILSGSAVRLFNLSPDTASIGLKVGGATLVDHVDYTIGSDWAPITSATQEFQVFNDKGDVVLQHNSVTPPDAPQVFTQFFLGMSNATGSALGPQMVPLIDAPENY